MGKKKQKTKLDLDRAIAESFKMHRTVVSKITSAFLEQITNAVVVDSRIELRSFCVLRVCEQRERNSRNPKTGQLLVSRAKRVVRFKASELLCRRLNKDVS